MRKIVYTIIFLLGVSFNFDNLLISKDYIFRRIRDMKSKEEIVVDYFIKTLIAEAGDRILAVYIVPKKLREKEERIDLVIIYNGIKEIELSRIATEVNFQILEKYDEFVYFAPLSKEEIFEEFDRYFSASPLWRIFQAGSYLYIGPKGKDSLIEVSKKFITQAEERLKETDFYHSFQALYRAVLTLLNAIVGAEEIYSSESGDIFEQFRESFILTEKVPADWDEKIDRLRELNKKLNQNPDVAIDIKELTSLIDFVGKLYLYVKD